MTATPPPRPSRASVILYADVRATHGRAASCRVRNLSATGACVDNGARLAEGDRVRVTMGSMPTVDAEVVWAKPALAGLRFAREVDLVAARRPVKKAPGGASAGWVGSLDDPYRQRTAS